MLSPRRYLLIAFVTASLLIGAFIFVLYRQLQVTELYNNQVEHSYEVLRLTRRTLTDVLDLETGQRGYLLTGAKSFLEPYRSGQASLNDDLSALAILVSDNMHQMARLQETKENIIIYQKLLDEQIDLLNREGPGAITFDRLRTGKESMDSLRNSIDAILQAELQLLQERVQASRREDRNYQLTMFMGAALAIGGLFLANMFIIGLMARSRRAEKELAQFEEIYRLVLDGLDDGVYDYHPDTGVILFSPGYERLLGYSSAEMPNGVETLNRLMHPEDYERTWDLLGQYIRREIPAYTTEFRLRHKDGSWRWILARGIGVWDDTGRIRRVIGTHTDITPQKEREEELKQLNDDLESFAYIASHDLRAPLVNLKGFAGEITREMELTAPLVMNASKNLPEEEQMRIRQAFEEDIPESLGFIRSSVEKMDKLTAAILDLSRIGRREYRNEWVDADAIIKRCADALAYEITSKNIQLTIEPLPQVITDPLALEQILGNILDNAVKYLEPSRPGIITVKGAVLPGAVQYVVSDNGRGIADNDKSKVFDIFRRASNSGNVRGAGMGMAYVKATVRKLGGRIWFDSRLGEGTTFYLLLPARDANVPRSEK